MRYFIYVHTNLINNKKYVGITTRTPESRWNRGKGYVKNHYFYKAIQKYGWDSFQHEVFEISSREDMLYGEKYLIAFYRTTDSAYGYNLTSGGEHYKHSAEAKKKISIARKEKYSGVNHPCYGRHLSKEHKQALLAANLGRHPSEEVKRKISESEKGKKFTEAQKAHLREVHNSPNYHQHICRLCGEKNGMFGKHHTQEARNRMSVAHKGKGGRAILQFDKHTLEFIAEWKSIKEAATQLGILSSEITHCCRGDHKSYKGYIWKYKDNK